MCGGLRRAARLGRGDRAGYRLQNRMQPRHGARPRCSVRCARSLGSDLGRGYAELAPDWVAEILSPSDRPGEVLEKVGQWLNAGVRLVWVLDPGRHHTRIYRADGTMSIVGLDEELDGEDVIPGFRCPLRDIF